jgi:hypothetical protein
MIRMSDAEIFREVDEDYRRERMIVFWRRYGGIFLAVAIAAMLASAGYNYYVSREVARKAADTEAFEALLNNIKPENEAESIVALSTFAAGASPVQATLAHFTEAAIKQRMGNVTAAAEVYHQIADGDQASQELKDLAVVRLGYLAVDAAKPEPLIPRLEAVAAKQSPWRFGAREAIALLKAKAGQRDEAARMLSGLALDPGAPPDMAARDRALAELYRGK